MTMHHLEIKHLRMLSAIAATGNMTRAAATLCISQSALSQQLKDIEGKLGADLFFRTPKRMLLTPIGKKLQQTAEQVVSVVDQTELEIARIVSGEHGELKVGTQCLFCFKWLPRVMRRFQDTFPNIAFEIGASMDMAGELNSETFDVIITATPVGEAYDSVDLFADWMVCIMPDDHPLATRPFIRIEDFSLNTLITHAEKTHNRFYQLVLAPRGIEPQRFMAVGQPQAIVDMVAAGFGIGILPHWAVAHSLDANGLAARPIGAGGFPLTYRAAYLRNRRIPVFQEAFIDIVRQTKIAAAPP